MRKPAKHAYLDGIVRRACERELTKMQTEGEHLHDGWTGAALASWIAPGIIRAVKRALASKGRRKP